MVLRLVTPYSLPGAVGHRLDAAFFPSVQLKYKARIGCLWNDKVTYVKWVHIFHLIFWLKENYRMTFSFIRSKPYSYLLNKKIQTKIFFKWTGGKQTTFYLRIEAHSCSHSTVPFCSLRNAVSPRVWAAWVSGGGTRYLGAAVCSQLTDLFLQMHFFLANHNLCFS